MFNKKSKLNKIFNKGVDTFVNLPEYDFKLHYDYFIHKKLNKEIEDLINLYKTFNKKYDDIFTQMFKIAVELRKTIK